MIKILENVKLYERRNYMKGEIVLDTDKCFEVLLEIDQYNNVDEENVVKFTKKEVELILKYRELKVKYDCLIYRKQHQ